jgi:hypothetical protein
VLACAEQHLGDVPAIDRPTQEILVPGEGRDNVARRKASLVVEIERTPCMGGPPLGQSLPWKSPISSEAREGHEVPVMLKKAYRADPKRTDDGASESPARGRCPHGRLRWDRRNTRSQSGVPHHRHARPGGTTDGDGTDDGEGLAPPFRGNTYMGKRESRIIAGTCRGKRK